MAEQQTLQGFEESITLTVPFRDGIQAAERELCVAAMDRCGSIVGAARLLKITRHALKRRLIKHGIAHHADGEGDNTGKEAAPK